MSSELKSAFTFPAFTHPDLTRSQIPNRMNTDPGAFPSPNGHKARSMSMSSVTKPPPKPRRKLSMSSTGSGPSVKDKATHVCPECSRAFSRAEHLERHLTTHMPATQSKTFICQTCGKGFTRKDVLTRHVRAVHETPKTEVKRSRRRSCRRCANFKIKCSGGAKKGQPQALACEACIKRQVDCIFDVEPVGDGEEDGNGQYGQANSEEMDEYSSENGDFKSEVSEPALKRRRTVGAMPERTQQDNFNAYDRNMDMSQHLLSAALYMSDEQRMEAQYPWMDTRLPDGVLDPQLAGAGTGYGQNGHQREADTPIDPQIQGNHGDRKENQYNTPFQAPTSLDQQHPDLGTSGLPLDPSLLQLLDPSHLTSNIFGTPPAHHDNDYPVPNGMSNGYSNDLHSVPEEDYHAASTLQGLLPGLVDGLNTNNSLSGTNGYSMLSNGQNNDANNMFANGDSNMTSGVIQQQNPTKDPSVDAKPLGDPKLNLQLEDQAENWFFDPGVFEFDWLRGDLVDLALPMKDYPNESQMNSAAPTITNNNKDKSINANNTPILSTRSLPFYTPPDFSHITNKKLESHIRSTAASETQSTAGSPKHTLEDTVRLPPVSPPKGVVRNEDAWPWDWQLSSEKQQKISLPPLRQVLEECTTPHSSSSRGFSDPLASLSSSSPSSSTASSSSNPNVTDKIRQDMISLLTVPFKKQPYVPLDISLEKFPNNDLFNDFIRLYFENFHGVLPMVHVPTFRPEKCPSILLAAIATIGARYHPAERAKDFADSLSELSHRAMSWMGEYNNNYLHSGFFLMAFCLQNVYALGAGNRHLFEMADASRSFLINNARRAGLFTPSSGVATPAFSHAQSGSMEDPYLCKADLASSERLESRWLAWRDDEADKRLAWCIFEYDSAISTLSNRRGNIAFNDMCMRIPCEEVLWEAPNAQAWASLYPRYRSNPAKGLPFYPVLRDVISGKMKPTLLPNWGKRLCSQVIARIIWDFKELEDSALNRCLVLPMLTPGLKPAKDTLLRTLMVLVNSMTEREGMSEMIHMSMTLIISHHSFLYAARDIMDLAISLARKATAPTSTASIEERAERILRMKNIFTADPVNARALAWHAVQILAIGRSYHVHTSCDTLRVFMGGVYLWAFAKYFPAGLSTPPSRNGEQEGSVKLDYLPWQKTGSKEAEGWIRNGGRGRIEGVEWLNSGNAAGDVLKLVMELLMRMKLWGIGEKFCMAVQEMTLVD